MTRKFLSVMVFSVLDQFCVIRVFLRYCDGGSFSGNRETTVLYNNMTLYFRGFRNLQAMHDSLNTKYHLNQATDVVIWEKLDDNLHRLIVHVGSENVRRVSLICLFSIPDAQQEV